MHEHKSSAASIALYFLCVSASLGAEIRTYSFVADVPAYHFSCGECIGPPYSVRAEVEGTFEVSLDFQQGVGTLHSLDARLTNFEGNFGPDVWQPIAWEPQEFLGPSSYYDAYRPPFGGILTPADYRPLGPATLTAEHMEPYLGVPTSEIPDSIAYWLSQGIGFEPAPAGSWILSFDGAITSPDGLSTSIVASYNIYLEGNEALFTYYIPIIDAVPSIAAASATFVPEPAALSMACLALIWLAVDRRRRDATRRCSQV